MNLGQHIRRRRRQRCTRQGHLILTCLLRFLRSFQQRPKSWALLVHWISQRHSPPLRCLAMCLAADVGSIRIEEPLAAALVGQPYSKMIPCLPFNEV